MPFITGPEKIGTLSHSSGIISLAPSVLNIGGQQYRTTSTITLTLPTLTVNTLYMLYAVVVNGVVTLVQSTNVNSIGPAGHLGWKLVGAYYSDGLATVAFGSFVTIEGAPTSGSIYFSPTIISGGSSVSLNGTAPIQPTGRFRREGDLMYYYSMFRNGSGGAATGGAGGVQISIPSGMSLLSVPGADGQSDGSFGVHMGTGQFYSGSLGSLACPVFQASSERVSLIRHGSGSAIALSDLVASASYNVRMSALISGWSNTPLKDL